MIRRILVPLDGSGAAEVAVAQARVLLTTFDAELLLLRVVEPGRAGGLTSDSVEWRLQKAEGEGYLETVAGPLRRSGLDVSVRVAEGRPAEEILRTIRDLEVDLVCLSTEGQTGPCEFRMGSVAHKVISRAGVSVFIVRPSCLAEPQAEGEYRTVIVPVDGSQRAEWAACLAGGIARAQGAELLLVHAVIVPESVERLGEAETPARDALVRSHRAAAEKYLAKLEEKLAGPTLGIRRRVIVSAHVLDALLRCIRSEPAALVVLSAHGASEPMPWPYGGVTSSLINHCDAPLLVLQDLPRGSREVETAEAATVLASAPDVVAG